jgi:hypothetical protein
MFTVATNLIVAVAMVESAGNPSAVNRRHGAYGPLQIRQMCLTDINQFAGTAYTLRQFINNLPLSKWAFEVYATMYNAKSEIEAVRIWHGGPRGKDRPEYDEYTRRVMALYYELNAKNDKENKR